MKDWVQLRIARLTDKFEAVKDFYGKGLGFPKVGEFTNHTGYDGVMFGLPDKEVHLEFTRYVGGSPCPAPTKDNLLVFYIPESEKIKEILERLASMGIEEKEPENPYWSKNGFTVEDPDGWRVVLMNTKGLEE